MNVLYVVKEFGKYHYFNSVEKRDEFINSLTSWEQKAIISSELHFGKAV